MALSHSLYSQKNSILDITQGPKYASAEAVTWEVLWKIGVLKFAVKILGKSYEEVHF